ncbi:MAG TPA: branched-chain amino acid ABC transporter permease, partial [Ruminococcus sp.]|nr:branched-chain amino acid ABC transporter permease [Ruminococcus sp.]
MRNGASFRRGLMHGIPIALGYLSVSFGFGILAVKSGLSVTEASMISLLNLTSAGQAAGVGVMAHGGSLAEMALVQLTINIRYALMALSLSQKLDKRFTLPHRMLAAYGITDEIFGVCAAQEEPLVPVYMYGMTLIAATGWVTGTFLGAFA